MTNSLTTLLAVGVLGLWILDFILIVRVFTC